MSLITADYLRHSGDDLAVVNAAKISFDRLSTWGSCAPDGGPESLRLYEADARLIQFLARGMSSKDYDALIEEARQCDDNIAEILHRFRDTPTHKSPFNHCFVSFRCSGPIFSARQLVKHEYLPWNEVSGRYVEYDFLFYKPAWRRKAKDKKQGSGGPLDNELAREADSILDYAHSVAYRTYKQLLQMGVAEEQARGVLPLNLITEWEWSGSLHAWANMCKARLRVDAQEESRQMAQLIDAKMIELFPVSWRALVHPLEPVPHA